MALLCRNVIVIDVPGERVLLSPLLLHQNMSQSRLGDWKIHHVREWGKFRMTEHNKQSQEVGLQKNVWLLCAVLKQLKRIKAYKAHTQTGSNTK